MGVFLNTALSSNYRALEHCGTRIMGGHTEVCNDCGESRFIPRLCRNRLCPSCHKTQIDERTAQ